MNRLQVFIMSLSLVMLAFSASACSEPKPVAAEYVPEDCECAPEGDPSTDEAEEPSVETAGFSFISGESTESTETADESEETESAVWVESEADPDSDETAPAEGAESEAAPAKKDANGLSGHLNLNEASMNQLMLLPGVGPALAERIVSYREKRKFTKTIHLKRVRGIGDATFAKMESYLRVSGTTTLSE
jgi:competence protein ComEA